MLNAYPTESVFITKESIETGPLTGKLIWKGVGAAKVWAKMVDVTHGHVNGI